MKWLLSLSAASILAQSPVLPSPGGYTNYVLPTPFVQKITNGFHATSGTASFATLPTIGNFVIVYCGGALATSGSGGCDHATITDNQSGSYSSVISITQNTGGFNRSSAIFCAPITASSGTYTVTLTTTASTFVGLDVMEYTGLQGCSSLDGSAISNFGSGTVMGAGTLTTSNVVDVIISGAGSDNAVTWTPSTGFTTRSTTPLTFNATAAVDKLTAATGSFVPTITSSNSSNWTAVAVAFKHQ